MLSEYALHALALDSTGNVYVAGITGSSDFPGVGPGSADSTFAGISEGFVAKLNSDLSSILAATFLGGGVDSLIGAGVPSPWTARGMSMWLVTQLIRLSRCRCQGRLIGPLLERVKALSPSSTRISRVGCKSLTTKSTLWSRALPSILPQSRWSGRHLYGYCASDEQKHRDYSGTYHGGREDIDQWEQTLSATEGDGGVSQQAGD